MDKSTHIYLIRHGQTEWNVEHRMQGHQDSPLTILGIQQAQWLGEAMKDKRIDAIHSSSSNRAYHTAEWIRNGRELDIERHDALREIHLGDWEGLTQGEVKEKWPVAFDQFWNTPHAFVPHGGETFQDVLERSLAAVRDIIRRSSGMHVVIVAHTVVVKVLMAHFEGRRLEDLWNPPYIHPACLCHIVIDAEDQPSILMHGDISHYKELVE